MKYELYRQIDLIIFGILMIFSCLLSLFLFSNHSLPFYFSFTTLLLFITLVRWRFLGMIPFVLTQIILSVTQIFCFHTKPELTFAVNLGACLFLWILPLVLRKIKQIRKHPFFLIGLLILTFLLIGAGESLGLVFVGDFRFLKNFGYYLLNEELFSLILSIILILLLRNIDNLIVNVREHLLELKSEKEDEIWRVSDNEEPLNKQ